MKGILTAAAATASLILAAGAAADEHISNEAEIRIQMELEANVVNSSCQAQLEMEYYQKGSNAVVESVLTNEQCAASAGTYVIQVRYRGSDSEIRTKDFPETWQRSDNEPIKNVREYFVGDDVDVIRVRSRKLRCSCTDRDEPADE
ncbi:MAG: hypothetical protein ACE5F8_00085 [Woeseiaceae bacterium]